MKYIKKTLGIVAIPVICLLIMSAVCRFSGTALFTGFSTVQLYFRGLAYVLLLSLGVSINLHTGRFDFSTGAVMLIGGFLVLGSIIRKININKALKLGED